jgi:serine/threonine protein kinase
MEIILQKTKNVGEGSYGKVFVYKSEKKDKKYAVKIFDAHSANLLETSILATFRHPYIIHAEYIDYHAGENKIYMFMPLAKSDLLKHLHKTPFINSYTKEKLWCYQIAKAVECLHNHKIIHADLKPSNILFYHNDLVKITDFTLTVKSWHDNSVFRKQACTINYRPPEVFIKGIWNMSLDIWSLACLFYEIVFRVALFHHQKDLMVDSKCDAKKILYQRMFNALLDWRHYSEQEDIEDPYNNKHKINYNELKLHQQWESFDSVLKDLLYKMLRWKSNERISIKEVLEHPWFDEIKQTQLPQVYSTITYTKPTIATNKINRYATLIEYYSKNDINKVNNNIVQELALNLAIRCNDLHILEDIMIKIIVVISLKIIFSYNEEEISNYNNHFKNIFNSDYYNLESIILQHLYFLLHEL